MLALCQGRGESGRRPRVAALAPCPPSVQRGPALSGQRYLGGGGEREGGALEGAGRWRGRGATAWGPGCPQPCNTSSRPRVTRLPREGLPLCGPGGV